MKLLSGILGATLTSVVALATANAADIYVPGPVGPGSYKDAPWVATWTGFYVGAHVGGAWGDDRIADLDKLNGGARYHMDESAVIGGGQLGYNWQQGNFVFGSEVDIGGIGFSARKFDPNFVGGTFSGIDSGAYGDVTARLGYSFGSALAYAKGGFAFYDGHAFVDNHLGGFGGGRAFTDTFTGWTFGGGLEYLINPAWSVKVEYLHFDFGTENAVLHTPVNGTFRYSNDLTAETATVGINYHFGSAYVPLK